MRSRRQTTRMETDHGLYVDDPLRRDYRQDNARRMNRVHSDRSSAETERERQVSETESGQKRNREVSYERSKVMRGNCPL
jgi:hypothetical protein